MRTPTKAMMRELIEDLRAVPPKRALTYGESIHASRVQAARYRKWVGINEPEINLIGLVKQRLVPVNFVPSYRLDEGSGLTTDEIEGRLQIFINQNEPLVRQRFSLLHEFKHVLDFSDAATLHDKLGYGNAKLRHDMVEWVCNEFAAHVLMPTSLVKRVWFATQDLGLAANVFNVSAEAMATRLEKLGLVGGKQAVRRTYFRRVGGTMRGELAEPDWLAA